MNDTEMDARLRQAAEQWRSTQPGLNASPPGSAEISFKRIPARLGPDRRRRWPTVIAAGAAAVLVLGAIGLLIDKAASRTDKPAASPTASAAASHTAVLPPLPPNGTTPPPGTGRFFGPAISPPDHALAAPRVAHGPGRSIVVSIEGSGTCPHIATRVRLTGPQQLLVDSIRLPAQSSLYLCTADLSPHLTTLPLPADADPGKPLEITIDRYTIELPAR